MAAADDKKARFMHQTDALSSIHVNTTCKNIIGVIGVNPPADHPAALPTHTCYDFAGFTVPDNTDYPDSIAPIGSTYRRFIVSGGAVTGASMYLKTAAGTWTVIGAVA